MAAENTHSHPTCESRPTTTRDACEVPFSIANGKSIKANHGSEPFFDSAKVKKTAANRTLLRFLDGVFLTLAHAGTHDSAQDFNHLIHAGFDLMCKNTPEARATFIDAVQHIADTDVRTVFEKLPVKTHAVVKEKRIKDYLADMRHDVMNDDAAR